MKKSRCIVFALMIVFVAGCAAPWDRVDVVVQFHPDGSCAVRVQGAVTLAFTARTGISRHRSMGTVMECLRPSTGEHVTMYVPQADTNRHVALGRYPIIEASGSTPLDGSVAHGQVFIQESRGRWRSYRPDRGTLAIDQMGTAGRISRATATLSARRVIEIG